MDHTTTAKQDVTATIRGLAANVLRREHPYMKTQTLEKLLDTMTVNLRDGIQEQQQELEHTKARASFFMLPAELRNNIYELVLTASKALHPSSRESFPDLFLGAFKPGLLRASRQIYEEALPTFWSINTFKMVWECNNPDELLCKLDLDDFSDWNLPTDDEGFAMIKNLHIHIKLNIGADPLAAAVRPLLPRSRRPRLYSMRDYTEAINERSGTDLEELVLDSSANVWSQTVIKMAMPLDDYGIEESAVKIEISTY